MEKYCSKCKQSLEIGYFCQDKSRKDRLDCWCKECRNNYSFQYRKKYPWRRCLEGAKQRCNNPKSNDYHCYGGKGIKCFLNEKDIKFLWERDKVYLLTRPSLDRIDSNKNYCLENCQFIEWLVNVQKRV